MPPGKIPVHISNPAPALNGSLPIFRESWHLTSSIQLHPSTSSTVAVLSCMLTTVPAMLATVPAVLPPVAAVAAVARVNRLGLRGRRGGAGSGGGGLVGFKSTRSCGVGDIHTAGGT